MTPWRLAMLIVALPCFALAGIGVAHPRYNLVAIGLFMVSRLSSVACRTSIR